MRTGVPMTWRRSLDLRSTIAYNEHKRRQTSITNNILDLLSKFKTSLYIITGDADSRAKMWSPQSPCIEGKIMERVAIKLKLESLFDPNRTKCSRPNIITENDSWIDVILISAKLIKIIRPREVIDYDYSDHRGLMFCINNEVRDQKITHNNMPMNTGASLQNLDFLKLRSLNQEIIEYESLILNNAMKIIWCKSAQVKVVKHRWLPRGIVSPIRKVDCEKKKKIKRVLHTNTDDH